MNADQRADAVLADPRDAAARHVRRRPPRCPWVVVALVGLMVAIAAGTRWRRPWGDGSAPGPPNLILITIDTLRADHLGCYGHPHVKTPTIDRLALQSLRYAHCYTTVPLTLPAHTSMMTGLYPFSHGVHDNGQQLDARVVTLAEQMAGHGYETAAFVGAFVLDRRFGLDQGFDRYDDDLSGGTVHSRFAFPERNAEIVTDAALDWLARRDGGPMFLWVHYFDPHAPYAAPTGGTLTAPSDYDAEVTYVDSQLARLLHAVAGEPALLMLTADHGEALGEHGETTHGTFVYNSTMHVPLLVRRWDGKGAGRVIKSPVSVTDIFPTALDWLGHAAPEVVHGRPLPMGEPGATQARRDIYMENLGPAYKFGWSPLHALVQAQTKYIAAPDAELFDLAEDRHELRNLFPVHSQRAAVMAEDLQALVQDPGGPDHLDPGQRVGDATTLEQLQALGYVAAIDGEAPFPSVDRPDPKAMVEVVILIQQAQQWMHDGKALEAAEIVADVLRTRDPLNLRGLWLMADLASQPAVHALAVEVLAGYEREEMPEALRFFIPAKLGVALAGLHRYEEAAEACREALAVDDGSAPVHANLAEALRVLGGPMEASIHHLQRAVDLEPANDNYRRRLHALQQGIPGDGGG